MKTIPTPLRFLRSICVTALCGALAALLMCLDFPLTFIAPAFIKLDFSEVPCLICGFALGPVWGIASEAVKILVKLLLKPTSTIFVGELTNLILGIIMVGTASLIYGFKKSLPRAIHSLGTSSILMSIAAGLLNAYWLFPFYMKLYGLSAETIVAMSPSFADNMTKVILFCVIPFNLLKGALVSLLTGFLYKPLKKILLWGPKK